MARQSMLRRAAVLAGAVLVATMSPGVMTVAGAAAPGGWAKGVVHHRSLPPLRGQQQASARDVNASGQVAGTSWTTSTTRHAVRWTHDKPLDLGTLGGAWSEAVAINERGDVAGNSATTTGETHAFLWTKGRMIDLGDWNGQAVTVTKLNDRGDVLGYQNQAVALLWSHGRWTQLQTLWPYGTVSAADLNNQGWVAGTACVGHCSVSATAVVWVNGSPKQVAPSPYLGLTWTVGLSDGGTVLENVEGMGGIFSVLVRADGSVRRIDPPTAFFAADLNNREQVVGQNWPGNHAVLWSNGAYTDLTDPGDSSIYATKIDDHGTVIGWFVPADASRHGFVWASGRRVDLGAGTIPIDVNARYVLATDGSYGNTTPTLWWVSP